MAAALPRPAALSSRGVIQSHDRVRNTLNVQPVVPLGITQLRFQLAFLFPQKPPETLAAAAAFP
jgi:hypothetical protein